MSKGSPVVVERLEMEGEQDSLGSQELRVLLKDFIEEEVVQDAKNVNVANFTHEDEELEANSITEAIFSEETNANNPESYGHIGHVYVNVDTRGGGVQDIVNEGFAVAPVDAATTDGTPAKSQLDLTKWAPYKHDRQRLLLLSAPDPSPFVVPQIPPPKPPAVEAQQQQSWNFSAITSNTAGPPSKSVNMENCSPRSSSSGYSTTQENDPEYIRKRLEAMAAAAAARSQPLAGSPLASVAQDQSSRGESSKVADTSHSYDVGEMGHLTLNYELPVDIARDRDDVDDEPMEDQSQGVDLGPRHTVFYADPRTPAPKAIFEHPGTVMRPSQLFATTQPSSTAFRGLHGDEISSSRPSPNLFNNHLPITHMTSSPLLRHVGHHDPSTSATHNTISSPFHTADEEDVDSGPKNFQDDEVIASSSRDVTLSTTRVYTSLMTASLPRNVPEPHERYISGKESQERRLRATSPRDDLPSSEDDWSDNDGEKNRLVKLRKDAARRELAKVRPSRLLGGSRNDMVTHSRVDTVCSEDDWSDNEPERHQLRNKAAERATAIGRPSRPSGSARSDVVEVPSTNNGRRRSIQEDYVAQFTGHDTRDTQEGLPTDTQPDVTIADSQKILGRLVTAHGSSSQIAPQRDNLMGAGLHSCHDFQEDSSPSSRPNELELADQLPGLELATASSSSTTDGEVSYSSPLKAPATQALNEVSGNRNELGTPLHKSFLLNKDDELVPETSPLEADQRRYIGFENHSQPVASGDGDEVFNPFSQDVEYEAAINAMGSPSPIQPARRSTRRGGKKATQLNSVEIVKSPLFQRLVEASAAGSTPSGSGEKASISTMLVLGEPSSEYVTAPETFATTGLSVPEHLPPLAHIDIEDDEMDFAAGNIEAARTVGERVVSEEDKKCEVIAEGGAEATQPHKLRSGDMLKGPSRFLRRSTQGPETPAKKGTADQMAPPSSAVVTTKVATRSSRRSSVKASEIPIEGSTSIRLTPVSTAGTAKASTRLSKRSAVNRNKPSTVLRSSTRRASVHTASELNTATPQQSTTPITSKRRKTGTVFADESGIFYSMAFSVSYSAQDDTKHRVVRYIEQNGGRVLENGFDELFNEVSSRVTSPVKGKDADAVARSHLTVNAEAREIGFTCVIADKHSRRAKYMQALALGLPCISGKWIEHSVAENRLLDWSPYLLAAGESSFLGGAIRSRSLVPYSAATANFEDAFGSRLLLLAGKSILLVMGKKKQDEERKKAYLFLTHVLGAQRVKRVVNNQEARKVLLEAENNGEIWDWVYVDNKEEDADKAIFGTGANRKRKRSTSAEDIDQQPPKRVRLISDEFVVQSLILGRLLEEE